jgi:hypothetical protein
VNAEVPNFDLSPGQLALVGEVGAALFEGRPLQASANGLIEIRPATEVKSEKGNDHDTEQPTHGPAAEPRQRWQGARGRRPSDSDTPQRVRRQLGSQLAELRQHYPDARSWGGDTNGTWLTVSSHPVGAGGPQATFLIAIPNDVRVRIAAWAFWGWGASATWIGSRHTNYPDGTVCAFPLDGGYWKETESLLPYLDLLSEWAFRQIFLRIKGLWPGPQEGLSAYYRIRETRSGECCPRCKRLTLYDECCRALDEGEPDANDRLGFVAKMGCDVGKQRPHQRTLHFALGKRPRPPRMARVHAGLRAKLNKPWGWED